MKTNGSGHQLILDDTKPIYGIVLRKSPNNTILGKVEKLTEVQLVQQKGMYERNGYDCESYCMFHIVHNHSAKDVVYELGFVGSGVEV